MRAWAAAIGELLVWAGIGTAIVALLLDLPRNVAALGVVAVCVGGIALGLADHRSRP